MSKISVIIPFKEFDAYTETCLKRCLKLEYDDFEIILLPDDKLDINLALNKKERNKIKIIPTGAVRPSVKRNIGAKNNSGEIYAFLDSDAYPDKEWLDIAINYLKDNSVGIVGGPSITPNEDTEKQKASGEILGSFIGAGRASLRYKTKELQEVNELPSCNLFVKKEIFNLASGFDSSLLTAEDAKMCFSCKKTGKKVLYVPELFVYHHRRELFWPHMKQMFVYARDKTFLIKEDFEFGKIYYFLPMVFVLFLFFGGLVSIFSELFRKLFIFTLIGYILIAFLSSIFNSNSIKRFYLIFLGTILTHLSYGAGSLYGILKKK